MANLAALGGSSVTDGLRAEWPDVGEPEREAVLRAFERRQWCRLGVPEDESDVTQFEREWSSFHDAEHAVAVANGTVALMAALWALGIRAGDEVIVPSVTFIASSDAIVLAGGVPVFVDVVPDTYQSDPDAVEAAITDRTRAILVVHYAGYPCDLDRIAEVARRHDLPVVEDCAHAQGTEWRGRKVGATVTCGTFSFQQSKSLTAGEGGIVITNDADLAERLWAVHNCGRPHGVGRYEHHIVGGNLRLSEWEGAMLRAQLKRFPEQNARRQETAARIRRGLSEIGGLEPLREDERVTQRGFYFFVMRYSAGAFDGIDRAVFLRALSAEGIPCGAGYSVPVYQSPTYTQSGAQHRVTGCPVAERVCAEEQITLPQTVLLEPGNADLIVQACGKIAENIDELRQLGEA
ncbi:MAG: DegT/DnrJ/EryC1/StrS family aminotransferase [Candidatus Latescibacteria bacterium]|jgi:dTDP-4-amino-4,6-dideoxygalactose transaminase|nr:DegT/DnrJ/EryC1/StrS family aminotransferase [Candidatus Latescibacterota bacterium]